MDARVPLRITEPGVYDMPAKVYHSDCCDRPSLSSTGARLLVSECPAAYRWQRDNPPVKTEFEIGNATHLLTLEPDLYEGAVTRIPFDSYKKGEAQAQRDEARAAGRLPLTTPQQAQVDGMRTALLADPLARLALRGNVEVERSMFARDPEFSGLWLKCRPDILPPPQDNYLADVKTAAHANPTAFSRAIANYGYHQQAAWYTMVTELVKGYRPAKFYFLVVEKCEPYLVTTVQLDEAAQEWGEVLNRRARSLLRWCVETDCWPAYQPNITGPPGIFTLGLPEWARRDLERRHEAGELEPIAF